MNNYSKKLNHLEMKEGIRNIINEAKEEFSEKSFTDNYYFTYLVSSKAKYFFQLLSLCAGFFFVEMLLDNIFHIGFLSMVFAFGVLLIIEVLKHSLSKTTFNEMVKRGSYFRISAIPVFILIALSVYLSVNGVREYGLSSIKEPKYMEIEKTVYVNTRDSLTNLVNQVQTSGNYKTVIWSKSGGTETLSKSGIKRIESLGEEIKSLDMARLKAENGAKERFNREKSEFIAKQNNQINIIAGISLTNELLYIAVVWFCSMYRFRASLEVGPPSQDELEKVEDEVQLMVKESTYVAPPKILQTGFQVGKEKQVKHTTDYKKKYPKLCNDILHTDLSTRKLSEKHNLSESTVMNAKRQIL